ncbi:hypothetical protein RND71_005466 [Anisodus tanguticus]|uniref:Uncharacterized protein n=1 Tax=Anisodus tanguticus TaxID=243964 RepID=A0AAE1SQ36_9SOLA|nr:hypothetical protein RND71_005466 [Anisodus tanguticus]
MEVVLSTVYRLEGTDSGSERIEKPVLVNNISVKDLYGNPKGLRLPRKEVEENVLELSLPQVGAEIILPLYDRIGKKSFTVHANGACGARRILYWRKRMGKYIAEHKFRGFLSGAAEASYAGAAVETAGDNPSAEAHPTDDLELFAVGIHRERVEESLTRGVPTNKEEFHALRASLLRLSKEITDSPILATTYNDMALALNDLFALHKTAKNSHDQAVATLQHLGSLRRTNELQEQLFKLRVELEWVQAEIGAITLAICALDSAISTHDSSHSSLFRQSLQLDNKIWELGNQHVVWELDQKVGSEHLAKLKNEWTAWKSRLVQEMPTITTPLPTDLIAELSADTLMDLQSEAIVASIIQRYRPILRLLPRPHRL